MASYFEFRLHNLMSRYHISPNAETMLKAHENWKTGKIDEAELGRLIRLSPENRAAVIQTMVKLAGIMEKKPEESKHCLTMIEICGEVVGIADKPPPTTGFPSFSRLPVEIRYRVYRCYLDASKNPGASRTNVVIPYKKKGSCWCAPHEKPHPFNKHTISLALTSKSMRAEVMSYFYELNVVYFSCACEMSVYLRNDSFMKSHIRKVKFHVRNLWETIFYPLMLPFLRRVFRFWAVSTVTARWCGKYADKGILQLHDCALDSLTVVISKLTLQHPSHREVELQRYFSRATGSKMGLADALGFEELSAIRGVKEVDVQLTHKRRADVCSVADKAQLQRWLQSKVKASD